MLPKATTKNHNTQSRCNNQMKDWATVGDYDNEYSMNPIQ